MTRPPNVATGRPGIAADDPRHGTTRGHAAGCRLPCCREARNADERRRRKYRDVLGIQRRIDGTGTRRRIQALWAIGWTSQHIADACGWETPQAITEIVNVREQIYATTAATIAHTYERMSMTPGPSAKNRRDAARKGWLPPLAWDDIDDIDETPREQTDRRLYRSAELAAEWDHLRRCGVSIDTAARQLGVSVGAIEKAVERVRKEVAA